MVYPTEKWEAQYQAALERGDNLPLLDESTVYIKFCGADWHIAEGNEVFEHRARFNHDTQITTRHFISHGCFEKRSDAAKRIQRERDKWIKH